MDKAQMNIRVGDLFVETNKVTGESSYGLVFKITPVTVYVKWNDLPYLINHDISDVRENWLKSSSNKPWHMKYYPVKK
jgi:hypothetical protein